MAAHRSVALLAAGAAALAGLLAARRRASQADADNLWREATADASK